MRDQMMLPLDLGTPRQVRALPGADGYVYVEVWAWQAGVREWALVDVYESLTPAEAADVLEAVGAGD